MSDSENLYNLNLDELKEQARILGIDVKGNLGIGRLRELIKEAIGAKNEEEEKSPVLDRKKNWVTIVISEDEKDQQPAFVGVNGKSYWIRRGEPVAVPPEVVEALRYAQQVITDPKDGSQKKVPTYPFYVEA